MPSWAGESAGLGWYTIREFEQQINRYFQCRWPSKCHNKLHGAYYVIARTSHDVFHLQYKSMADKKVSMWGFALQIRFVSIGKLATAHKMLNVSKCHFKVKVFTFGAEPLKKLPMKLAKCRRDPIIKKMRNFTIILVSLCSLWIQFFTQTPKQTGARTLENKATHWMSFCHCVLLCNTVVESSTGKKIHLAHDFFRVRHPREANDDGLSVAMGIQPTYRMHTDQCTLGQFFQAARQHFVTVISTCTK